MASIILVLKIQTHEKSMYLLVACVISQKNHSSDVNNQNLEQMYMDKLTGMQLERIHTMIRLNERQLFGKAITCHKTSPPRW